MMMRPIPDMKKPQAPSERYDWQYSDGSRRVLYVTREQHILHSGTIIVSRTDANGVITHANRAFVETSGYLAAELIGSPHHILRHPDMPKECFQELWEMIKMGQEWHGYIKNLRKDGGYYWVYATVAPIIRDGTMVGCTSVRRKIDDERLVAQYELFYKQKRREEIEQNKEINIQPGFFRRLFWWR